MNAHIINIADEGYFLNTCIKQGFLSTGLYIKSVTPQGLSKACLTSYSMYADMKTIRSGDLLFIHAGTKIYGPFKAVNEFMEDPAVPANFHSKNIHYYPNPNIANSGWRNNIINMPNIGDYRKISFENVIDNNNNNISYSIGIESTELFDLKSQGKIFSIPERWKYADAARTVRPCFLFEATEILKLIELANSNNTNRFSILPFNMQNYITIDFILNDSVIENEKIIEGWLLQQFGRNNIVDNIFGKFTAFGNNVPIGYLKFIDILGYIDLPSGLRKYKVIEVKKVDCIFPTHIYQLIGYMNSVAKMLCNNDIRLVEGIIVAKNFDQNCIDSIQFYNGIGNQIKLIKFDYSPPNFTSLKLTPVI